MSISYVHGEARAQGWPILSCEVQEPSKALTSLSQGLSSGLRCEAETSALEAEKERLAHTGKKEVLEQLAGLPGPQSQAAMRRGDRLKATGNHSSTL